MSEPDNKKQSLITENLGLVHACAIRFKGRGVEYDDLFQAGCVGLVKASRALMRAWAMLFPPMRCPPF